MKTILKIHVVALLLISIAFGGQPNRFPKNPNLNETPGKVCTSSGVHRYPENISYCERNVDSSLKKDIIKKYDSLFGYTIGAMKREDFKIDHLIPLCAGGANSEENLWPQHISVYEITDPLEPLVCQKMEEGKLLQADAIKLILQAKMHLDQVSAIIDQLNEL
jgi:hypothetical protein